MREITIPQQTVYESIQTYEHFVGTCVTVSVGVGSDVNGVFQFAYPQTFKNYTIANAAERLDPQTGQVIRPAIADYDDLMSANPSWAPNKPAGTFRQDDLWRFIDLIRSRE